jgi:hypothetical protein
LILLSLIPAGLQVRFRQTAGWVSLIHDHELSDGHANADCWIFYVDSSGNVAFEDRFSAGFFTPSLDTDLGGQNDLFNVTGHRDAMFTYVSFARAFTTCKSSKIVDSLS